jgi:hypothetical protein
MGFHIDMDPPTKAGGTHSPGGEGDGGSKCYHLELMLANGTKCYHLERNVIIWDAMLSSGGNVIIWDEMLSSGMKFYY